MQQTTSHKRNRQSGFTIIEVMVGVVIFLLVTGLALLIWQRGVPKLNAIFETSNITEISSELKSTFSGFSDYSQLSDAMVISNNIVGKEMQSGTSIINRWSQPVTFSAVPHPGNAAQSSGAASITDTVPSKVCSLMGKNLSGDVLTLTVAGTQVKAYQTPVDLAALGSACSSSAYVPMIFVIGKS